MSHRSTTLHLINRYCPQALRFHFEGRKRDREVFAVGIAAHAILQAISYAKATEADYRRIADVAVESLICEGRWFDGVKEPPLSPEAAIEGRDIVLSWLSFGNDIPGGVAELGLGMDADGEPQPYTDCYYKAAVDLVYSTIEGDEDYSYTVGVVRDYKTSWVADESILDSLQSKGQAVLLWTQRPDDYDAIRQEAVNLRTGECYSRTIMLNDEGVELLAQWKADILLSCKAAEGDLVARPGANCAGCPYMLCCDDSFIASIDYNEKSSASVCNAYAATKARLDELDRLARKFCESSAIQIHGGVVGFLSKAQREPIPQAHEVLFDYWAQSQGGDWSKYKPAVLSLMKGLKVTTGNVQALAKVLFPARSDKEAREDFVAGCSQDKTTRRFSIERY